MESAAVLKRSRWFVLATLAVATLALVLAPTGAFAQEGAPAGEGGGGAPPSIIIHIIQSAGWVFGPIMLLVSVCLVALVVLLAMDLRMSLCVPPGFVEEFTDTVNKRKFKEAFDLARNDTSFLGRVLTAGMSRLQYGIEDSRDAAANMLDSIKSDKEQKNNYVAVIGSLGPLLGLVGTVFGMILAFIELGRGGTPNPAKLADGISHALVITLLGIGVAVPAVFFNAFFRNRITHVSMDTSHIADDLLTQMYHNSKKTGPTPSAAGAGGAATATDARVGNPPRQG